MHGRLGLSRSPCIEAHFEYAKADASLPTPGLPVHIPRNLLPRQKSANSVKRRCCLVSTNFARCGSGIDGVSPYLLRFGSNVNRFSLGGNRLRNRSGCIG